MTDRERFISIITDGRDVPPLCEECGGYGSHCACIDIPALMAATTSAMLEDFLPDVTLVTLDQADDLRKWYDKMTYASDQLQILLNNGPNPGERFYRLKVTGNGETNWVNITTAQLIDLINLLQ